MNTINIEALCYAIITGRVIPIIGNDIYDFKVIEALANKYSKSYCDDLKQKNQFNANEILNMLFHSADNDIKSGFSANIRGKIKDIEKEIYQSKASYAPFDQLARIKPLSLYINATFFNTLRLALNASTSGSIDEVSYFSPASQDLPTLDNDKVTNQDMPLSSVLPRPAIYNLLGSTDYNNVALTDADYVELLIAMFDKAYLFKNLQSVLKNCNLLFIGCNLPDWVLRFFIRFCRGGKIGKEKLDNNYLIEEIVEEPGKIYFLTNYGLRYSNQSPAAFVNTVYNTINNINSDYIEEKKYRHHVFISYNSQDKEVAQAINQQLVKNDIKTWFDETGLYNGEALDGTIQDAIDQAAIFLPILTKNTNKDSQQRKYYMKEWNYAMDNIRSKVYAIRTDDYTPESLYNKAFSADVKKSLLPDDGDHLIKRTTVAEKNAYLLQDAFLDEIKSILIQHLNV